MGNRREIIIMVDDDIINLATAKNSLADNYILFTASSGDELFLLLEKVMPALILLDINMPGMNRFEVMRQLKGNEKTVHIPVIFLTAEINPENETESLSLGAVDCITTPYSSKLFIKRINLHIFFEKQKKELLKNNLILESEVDKKTRTVLELQNAILKTVAELVERRDNVTGGHVERTQHYLNILLDSLLEHGVYTSELSSWDIDLFIMSSQLHDVGKISISDDILMKPGKLTDKEFEEMKKHAMNGVDIIRRIEENTTENEFLLYAEILAGSHHEKWNGKGYPYGLKGNEIPLHGRLMAIIDVYDALTNERPYKKAFSHEESVEIIKEEKGEHFDPFITEIFLAHEKEFAKKEINIKKFNNQNDQMHSTMKMLANAVGTRSGKEHGHVERMRRHLEIFVSALLKHENYKKELSSWDTELFLMSAKLHDVGKISVACHILNKTAKLTDEELEAVKTHADFGVRIVQKIKENIGNGNLLKHAEALVGSHHEKWDGTGYPLGLKGNEIPLEGRIMAIVDVYDALTSNRPHRKKHTHNEAVEIIMSSSGTHFDPELVDVFLECEKVLEKEIRK